MELTSSTSTGTLDTDTQTPPSFTNTNGFLNRRHTTAPSQPPSTVVSYKECLRNHAASLGGHALDGCGEFMPSLEPRSLTCAACGCHRNFHRRDTQEIFPNPSFISFYPSLPPQLGISPNTSPSPSPSPNTSPSPPPVSTNHFPSSYHRHNSATHVLLSLGNGYYDGVKRGNANDGKKRHRTKFSEEQKEKMFEFCEKLGWRMPNGDGEGMVQEFCNGIGVSRGVFKVWMHNNKNRKRLLQIENAPPPLDEKINGD